MSEDDRSKSSRWKKKMRRVNKKETPHNQSYLGLKEDISYRSSAIILSSTLPCPVKEREKNPEKNYNALNFTIQKDWIQIVDCTFSLIVFPSADHFSRP